MAPGTSEARKLTRRLVATEDGGTGALTPAVPGDVSCERLYGELSRWVGSAGCRALFVRALARAQLDRPELANVSVSPGGAPVLVGLPASEALHGTAAVAAGLETTLAELLELLIRLVGHDLTTQVVETLMPPTASADRIAP